MLPDTPVLYFDLPRDPVYFKDIVLLEDLQLTCELDIFEVVVQMRMWNEGFDGSTYLNWTEDIWNYYRDLDLALDCGNVRFDSMGSPVTITNSDVANKLNTVVLTLLAATAYLTDSGMYKTHHATHTTIKNLGVTVPCGKITDVPKRLGIVEFSLN